MRTSVSVLIIVVVAALASCGAATPQDSEQAGDIPPEVRRCMDALATEDLFARVEAAECLGELGAAAAPAVPALIELLADEATFYWDDFSGPEPRGGAISASDAAVSALVQIGAPAVPPLIEALGEHPNLRIRVGAAGALGSLDDPRAVEPLIRALDDRGEGVYTTAHRALERMTVPGLDDRLLELLEEGEGNSHDGAVAALMRRRETGTLQVTAAAVPRLVRLLDDPDIHFRALAVDALDGLGDPATAEPLEELLARERNAALKARIEEVLARLDTG